MLRKPVDSNSQSTANIDRAQVNVRAGALTEPVNEKQDPRFIKHLAHLREERKSVARQADLARKYECDPGLLSRILKGRQELAAPLAARIEAANPGLDFAPPEPTEATPREAMAAERAQATSTDLWLTWGKAERGALLDTATELTAAMTPEATLLGSSLYAVLYAAVKQTQAGAGAPLPEPAPTSDLADCLRGIEALADEASTRRDEAARAKAGDDALKLGLFVTSTRGKLKRLSRTVTAAELIAGEAWISVMVALCDALRFEDDSRVRLADAVEGVNALGADAARRLRLTRHIVYPTNQFRDDPVGFARVMLGADLWPGQIEILESIRDNRRVTIRSGNKCGKTLSLACACLWAFATFPRAEVILGAPTVEQLGGTLWKEISRLHANSGICLECRRAGVFESPCPHSQKLDGKLHVSCHGESGGLRSPDGRRIYGRVAADAGGLLGFSGGEGLLIVADESSELDPPSFTALEFNASAGKAKFVMCGNPLRLNNPQWETFNGEIASYWHPVHLSCEDAAQYADQFDGLMCRDQIEMAAKADPIRGRDSDEFRARVLGEYPLFDVELSLNDDDIKQAHLRWASMPDEGPLTIAIDPGGENDRADAYGFAARRGPKVVELYEKRCTIQDAVHGELLNLMARWERPHDRPVPVRFDGSSRLGLDFELELARLVRMYPGRITSGKILPGQASFKQGFKLWRDWLLDNLVLHTIKDASFPHCPDLDAQLRLLRSSQKLEDDKSIRTYIPKSQMRSRLHGASPNLLDAAAYCLSNIEHDSQRTAPAQAAQAVQQRQAMQPRNVHEMYRRAETAFNPHKLGL